jgi:hypothetical protein
VWGVLHVGCCAQCHQFFPLAQLGQCGYHPQVGTATRKSRIVTAGGWVRESSTLTSRFATPADSPLQDCSLTHTCTPNTAKVWDLSLVQGPFSVAPCQPQPSDSNNSPIAVWQVPTFVAGTNGGVYSCCGRPAVRFDCTQTKYRSDAKLLYPPPLDPIAPSPQLTVLRCTAIHMLRIVILRFGTARQKMVLE